MRARPPNDLRIDNGNSGMVGIHDVAAETKTLDVNNMLQTRLPFALLVSLLASSVSFAQTPIAESNVDVPALPVVVIDTVPEPVLGTSVESNGVVQPEVVTPSAAPAPMIPLPSAISPPESQLLGSGVQASGNSYQPQSQAYSPQRDGLPTLQQRRQLRAMPIEQRPNRPFHFYGNTVRRRLGR